MNVVCLISLLKTINMPLRQVKQYLVELRLNMDEPKHGRVSCDRPIVHDCHVCTSHHENINAVQTASRLFIY